MRLFEQHPDTKAIFRKFQGIDLMALEQSIEIKEHGERVMKIVDEVVHVIENPNKVWDMLISLGKIHSENNFFWSNDSKFSISPLTSFGIGYSLQRNLMAWNLIVCP